MLVEYHQKLVEHFPDETIELYLNLIEEKGQNSEGRYEYNWLAKLMKLVVKDLPASRERILAVAKKLKDQFPKRKAMIEEFDTILN